MPHTVFVIDGDPRISRIFQERPDFRLTRFIKNANIIIFPGGPDVSPDLYHGLQHKNTNWSPKRDKSFLALYRLVSESNRLKIGICGGGQFLNVMNRGRMFQDVDNHLGNHEIVYTPYPNEDVKILPLGSKYIVTSTHHQMMIPGTEAELWGYTERSTFRDLDRHDEKDPRKPSFGPDAEILFYPRSMSLCFQPHPEYGHKETETVFFKCIHRILAKYRVSSIPKYNLIPEGV